MASSLPSLQVRKVNEFLGRLIEIMAEVGTRSSMTSNHEISEGRFKYLAFEPLLFSLLML